ncbi:MAG: lysophospholipid acyltransferase family protein [Woeseiaceae bacterium]
MRAVLQWLGSLIFTFWMFFSVAFYALAILVMGPAPYRYRFAICRAWAALIMKSADVLCGITFEVRGKENLPEGTAIYMLKHSSAYETLAEIVMFPEQAWVLKRELQWVPIFGWALRLLRPIAINRSGGRNAVSQIIQQGDALLNDGVNVMIFPEGTRVRHGSTRRYGMSGAALAGATGKPMIPVAHDAGRYWPRRGIIKHPGVVTFVIGKPVFVGDRDIREVNAEMQQWVEQEIAAIDAEKRGGAVQSDNTRKY